MLKLCSPALQKSVPADKAFARLCVRAPVLRRCKQATTTPVLTQYTVARPVLPAALVAELLWCCQHAGAADKGDGHQHRPGACRRGGKEVPGESLLHLCRIAKAVAGSGSGMAGQQGLWGVEAASKPADRVVAAVDASLLHLRACMLCSRVCPDAWKRQQRACRPFTFWVSWLRRSRCAMAADTCQAVLSGSCGCQHDCPQPSAAQESPAPTCNGVTAAAASCVQVVDMLVNYTSTVRL